MMAQVTSEPVPKVPYKKAEVQMREVKHRSRVITHSMEPTVSPRGARG